MLANSPALVRLGLQSGFGGCIDCFSREIHSRLSVPFSLLHDATFPLAIEVEFSVSFPVEPDAVDQLSLGYVPSQGSRLAKQPSKNTRRVSSVEAA
jgi:hypothetical protein